MRHLMSRLLILLVLVGFLAFFNAPKSGAVALACNSPCQQACWATYRPCLAPNSPDFFQCCTDYNACVEACGCNPTCHLPEEYP